MDAGVHMAISAKRAGKRLGASRAAALLKQISAEHNIDVRSLKAKASFRHLVLARRDYCLRGLEMGIGVRALAGTLNRERTTILYHQRPDMQIRKKQWRAMRQKKRGSV